MGQGPACACASAAVESAADDPLLPDGVAEAACGGEAAALSSVQLEDDRNTTALLYAASRGDVPGVRALLRAGVDASTSNFDRRCALHVAAADGHLAVVHALLDARAAVTQRDRWGHTAAEEASRARHAEIVEVLQDAGAGSGGDPPEEVDVAETAETRAARVEFATALCCAAAAGSLRLVQDLHGQGADLDAADYDGRRALMLASAHGHVEIVRWLTERQVDVGAQDNFGYTAIREATLHGHADVAKVLCDAGAESGDMQEVRFQADSGFWAIPLSEVQLGDQLSRTLKSVVYLATWRGTQVVAKSTIEASKMDDDLSPCFSRTLSHASVQLSKGLKLTPTQLELVREINLLSKLRHPDLVMFLGACVEHMPPLLITEYMEGGDLERYFRGRAERLGHPYRPPTATQLRWASSVARALAFLHESEQPVIHRDLKPLNLLLNHSEELKVTDFGISKLMERARPSRDAQKNAFRKQMTGGIGTWRYMAPEVVRSEDYTDRVDIYAYGLILWFMCTGRQPFMEQLGRDPEAVLQAFLEGREPRPDAQAMKCPAEVRELTVACWHVAPSSRPSAVECAQRLAAIAARGHGQGQGLVSSLRKHLNLS